MRYCETIVRYSISRNTFSGKFVLPQNGAILSHRHTCAIPHCNISRENCTIPHYDIETSTKEFCDTVATLRLQVSLDVKSIAARPSSFYLALGGDKGPEIFHREVRKSVMSIKFPPAILGPEMAAPILWAPRIFWFFLLENPHAHKTPLIRGEGGSGLF